MVVWPWIFSSFYSGSWLDKAAGSARRGGENNHRRSQRNVHVTALIAKPEPEATEEACGLLVDKKVSVVSRARESDHGMTHARCEHARERSITHLRACEHARCDAGRLVARCQLATAQLGAMEHGGMEPSARSPSWQKRKVSAPSRIQIKTVFQSSVDLLAKLACRPHAASLGSAGHHTFLKQSATIWTRPDPKSFIEITRYLSVTLHTLGTALPPDMGTLIRLVLTLLALAGLSYTFGASHRLSPERIVFQTKHGDIEMALYPEVRPEDLELVCTDAALHLWCVPAGCWARSQTSSQGGLWNRTSISALPRHTQSFMLREPHIRLEALGLNLRV